MGEIGKVWEKNYFGLMIAVVTAVVITIPRHCQGKDISSMYTKEELKDSMESYTRNINYIYEKVIKPVLSKREHVVLDRIQLEYPLVESDDDPFHYFVRNTREKQAIVIPVFSVKFLDDLATASAWLEIKDFTTETVLEYVSMLKYREAKEFPGNRYPPPLEALQIPSDALEDNEVDELAKKFLRTSVIYLLSREIGSLYFSQSNLRATKLRSEQRQMTTKGAMMKEDFQSQMKEFMLNCDAFAMEVIRRIGIPAEDLLFCLSAQTYPAAAAAASSSSFFALLEQAARSAAVNSITTALPAKGRYFIVPFLKSDVIADSILISPINGSCMETTPAHARRPHGPVAGTSRRHPRILPQGFPGQRVSLRTIP